MTWNWQLPDWPTFTFDAAPLQPLEAQFLRNAGVVIGGVRHLSPVDAQQLVIELLSNEAVTTSAIEGEILDRASVQSSIRAQLGLPGLRAHTRPAERAIAAVMVDAYADFQTPFTHALLHHWHILLMGEVPSVTEIGRYRSNPEPMQIVSDRLYDPKVHFEAPPSRVVHREMTTFLNFLADTAADGQRPFPAVTRAGLAHLYFESIHPFEDGNGRIGRAVAEKCLAQAVGQPTITGLSVMIEQRRKAYYAALGRASQTLDVTDWLLWFADTVLAAQDNTRQWVDFLISKTHLLDRLASRLNPRQEKALVRILKEGPRGFKGGLSAANYATITGAAAATARRDLAGLVALGALTRTGQRKGTRYWLNLPAISDLTPRTIGAPPESP